MNYTEALKRMKGRRDPEAVITLESYGKLKEEDPVKYLVGAMSEISRRYTEITFEQAERVQNQILKGLNRKSLDAEFCYQGSVTKNTHILAYSDIDVLSLEKRFHNVEHPQVPDYPYPGDPVADLCEMREIIDDWLRRAFWTAEVDGSKAKCINISGGDLSRSVDVVPSNWYNTNQWVKTGNEVYRGVYILDYHKKEREADTPFIHTALFVQRDENFSGNLRRLVRLCKSLSYDSGRNDMPSSYDIEALIYAMGDQLLRWGQGEEIQLAHSCSLWLKRIAEDSLLRDSLLVPDGNRKIFAPGKTTLGDLNGLRQELESLLAEILGGLQRQSRTLTEASINHMVAAY